MSICPECHRENPPHYKFCLSCGADLTEEEETPSPPIATTGGQVCPNCGKMSPPRYKFCLTCGANLNAEDAAVSPAAEDDEMQLCLSCGEKSPLHHRFCLNCGTELNGMLRVDRNAKTEFRVGEDDDDDDDESLEAEFDLQSISGGRSPSPAASPRRSSGSRKILVWAVIGAIMPLGIVLYNTFVQRGPVIPQAGMPPGAGGAWSPAPLQRVQATVATQAFSLQIPMGLTPLVDPERVFWQDPRNAGGQSFVFIQVKAVPMNGQPAVAALIAGQQPATVTRSEPLQEGTITALRTSANDKIEVVSYRTKPGGAAGSLGLECRAAIQSNSGASLVTPDQAEAYLWGICGSLTPG